HAALLFVSHQLCNGQWPHARLHNGALITPICRSPFAERLFSSTDQSHKTSGYCWPTLFKVRGVLFLGEVSSAFLPSKKAWRGPPFLCVGGWAQYSRVCG